MLNQTIILIFLRILNEAIISIVVIVPVEVEGVVKYGMINFICLKGNIIGYSLLLL